MRLSPLVVILLTAAVGLAAPVPADDTKPKPRAKLLGTLKVKKAVEFVVWTPDGKHLILIADGKGLVVPREQLGEDAAPKPVAEFDLPAGSGTHFGVTPDGSEVYALLTAGTRFNAETRLCFWAVKDLLEGKKKAKPDRATSLEVDNPTSFALVGDGKSLFAVTSEARAGTPPGQVPQQVGKVFRLSARTGDIADEILTLDEKEASLVGAAVHPESGRVFAHFQTSDEHVVKCLELGTKKAVWSRRFDEPPPGPSSNIGPRVSPDGKAVVAFPTRQILAAVPVLPGQPAPGNTVSSSPHLLDTAKGEPIAALGDDDVTWSGVHDFSPDGKLAFGWLSRNSGTTQFVAWDTKTGKRLKAWTRGASITSATFAPARHELAVVERNDVYQPIQYSPQPWIHNLLPDFRSDVWSLPQQPAPQPAPEVYSIIGVWDLAPLVK